MIIQSKLTCRLRINDEEEIVFKEHEPVIIPARWAVPVLMKFPDAVELVSTVLPGPALSVTWMEHGEQSQTGMVVAKVLYLQEPWLLVITEGNGRLIRESEVIGVNVVALCRLMWEAAQHLGTSKAEAMAADMVTALCGIDPSDMTQ